MRAQAVLETLSHGDFEEIRSYRKPPTSVVLFFMLKASTFFLKVVLVVEAVCILFGEEATWDSGTMLLHKENFFEELEFFDKESVSQTAYQKLRHRLNRFW